ncbi:MAG: alpha-amylase family glycosyl hydrolase [Anaerolineales bacterium]
MDDWLWWRDGVIYQIYPRSFFDTNGDGLGDLPGITAKLDDLAALGVDALWLSPFYPTPDADFGYDIADHTAVDPRFGTLADFDHLLAQAHARGMRIILDMVMNHTSDQHPWFLESRASRDNPKRDWYIWRDQPNNWQAAFGGPAWTFDPHTRQYYLHSFTPWQPDINWRNPQAYAAQMDVFRFWLARGVDGFRLDVFNAYYKDAQYRSNPPKFGLRAFDRQQHLYDMDQPEMIPMLNDLRRLLDSYPERYAVGETYLATPQKVIGYCGPDKLHAAFSFDFTDQALSYPWSPTYIRKRIEARETLFNAAGVWPTTVLSNHDLPRAASRYCHGEDDRMAKIAMAVLLTLRGTPFLYQGEEIGMRDIALKRSEILDPPGKKYWPIYKGRDGCRSPMQWDSSPQAGFTTGTPWLPVHPNYPVRNLSAQRADPHSLYHFTRRLLSLRREHAALRRGSLHFLDAPSAILAYLRQTDDETVLVALNFSARSARLPLPHGLPTRWRALLSTEKREETASAPLTLQPFEACVLGGDSGLR